MNIHLVQGSRQNCNNLPAAPATSAPSDNSLATLSAPSQGRLFAEQSKGDARPIEQSMATSGVDIARNLSEGTSIAHQIKSFGSAAIHTGVAIGIAGCAATTFLHYLATVGDFNPVQIAIDVINPEAAAQRGQDIFTLLKFGIGGTAALSSVPLLIGAAAKATGSALIRAGEWLWGEATAAN